MKESITFIHCADLHLDSPFKGMVSELNHVHHTMIESTFQALDKLVEEAIYHQVDFILMAGDIFDHPHPSLKAGMRFKRAMEKLSEEEIQVFISYGNHDYSQATEKMISLPDNVHRFTTDKVTKKACVRNGITIANIYGFSYLKRAVTENKVPEYIIEEEDVYHIGMLHGSVATNTDHDPYAPFQVSELVEKKFNYWALGHIHKREILQNDPPVVYPGNLQGRSKKETGEKGCFLVNMSPHQTELAFLPLQQVRFESIILEVSELDSLSDLETQIHDKLSLFKNKIGTSIIDLTVNSSLAVIKKWQREGYLEELADIISERLYEENDWIYLRHIEAGHIPEWNLEELKMGRHFVGELIRNMDGTNNTNQVLTDLFNHKKARKYLEPLMQEEENKLKEEARNEVLNLLLREEEMR